MKCKICQQEIEKKYEATLMHKHFIKYFYCDHCGFMQTEEPYWLPESYDSAINITDTGIMMRNLEVSFKASAIINSLYDSQGRFLDFAGGYGIFTRLMRDFGYDFYWHDRYCPNLLSRGFDGDLNPGYELTTAFEAFEHFIDPVSEIESILKSSCNILFTTNLLPIPTPKPNDWWYYGLEHGQHVSFYSIKTLNIIAKKFGLNIYTNGTDTHLLTSKRITHFRFKLVLKMGHFGIIALLRRTKRSKTLMDMHTLIANHRNTL